jgi:uncharacterized protein DUF6093
MTLAITLARGRARAEALMVDTCTIRRVTSEVTDPFSGTITPTYTTVYSGKCKIQQSEAGGRTEDAGQMFLIMKLRELHLPVSGTEHIRRDDEVSLAASADTDLLGRIFYVRDIAGKTFATARRITIQERT